MGRPGSSLGRLFVRFYEVPVWGIASILFLVLIAHPVSAQNVPLVAGHVLGDNESMLAGRMIELASKQVGGGISVEYDSKTTDNYNDAGNRFAARTHLADLVFLYAGSTALLGEIQGLADRGLLQPLDASPGVESILNTTDIYENLLTPVRLNGHLWAMPLRPCPPCLVVETGTAAPGNWMDMIALAQKNGFRYPLKADPYTVWLSAVFQRGGSLTVAGKYDLSTPVVRNAFGDTQKLFKAAKIKNWAQCRMGIAVPDDFVSAPDLTSRVQPLALPKEGKGEVFTGENTWYVGIASHATGPVREACLKIIAAMMSTPVQMALAEQTCSPPVRPSIVASKPFRDAFAASSPQAVFAEMTPRLVFRKGGSLTAKTEPIIEKAAIEAMGSEPDAAISILAKAAAQANDIVSAQAKP